MTKKSLRGFTFIELLVVIVVIAILFSIGFPAYTSILERAKITKDMNNLRQIGLATQTYMNDNDGVFPGSTTATWMSRLNPKYLSAWGSLQSPFDGRSPSELGDGTTPISYGINANVYPGGIAISADRITKPTGFILFAPAQAAGATVTFLGVATSPFPGVKVLGIGSNTATSTPGGDAIGGTQNNRNRINALFADLHCETMAWAAFTSTTANPGEPDQWTPYIPYP